MIKTIIPNRMSQEPSVVQKSNCALLPEKQTVSFSAHFVMAKQKYTAQKHVQCMSFQCLEKNIRIRNQKSGDLRISQAVPCQ